MMIVKQHKTEDGRLILAVCDKNVLGKVFEEGERILDTKSDFFQGEEKTPEQVDVLLKDAYIANIVGKESVEFFIKRELVDEKNVLEVEGIPNSQVVIVKD